MQRRFTALLFTFVAVGCAEPSSPGGAATAVGVGVAAAGINRAITKQCWAQCSKGYVCNRESGLCEPGECTPACGEGYFCTMTKRGNQCLAQGTPVVDPIGDPSRKDRLGPRGTRGDPIAVESPRTENAKKPEHNEGGQVRIARGDPGAPPNAADKNPQSDQVRRVPRELLRARGAEIYDELSSLVTSWQERLADSTRRVDDEAPVAGSKVFENYIDAVHRRSLHDVFSQGYIDSLGDLSRAHALSNDELRVTVEIIIDGESGKLSDLALVQSSGSELFDVGTLEALSRAAPFPPAPESLRSDDGQVYIHWTLHRHMEYACSTSFAKLFLLED